MIVAGAVVGVLLILILILAASGPSDEARPDLSRIDLTGPISRDDALLLKQEGRKELRKGRRLLREAGPWGSPDHGEKKREAQEYLHKAVSYFDAASRGLGNDRELMRLGEDASRGLADCMKRPAAVH